MKLEEIRRNLLEGENKNQAIELLGGSNEFNCLKKAIAFAEQMHGGVKRINGAPYIQHPLRVAKYVREFKTSKNLESLLEAACLHDVIEDTIVSYSDIANKFGTNVSSLVLELTTDEDMKDAIGKTKYLSIKMKNMSSWALVIKLCDVLDNVSDLQGCPLEFRNKVVDEKTAILIFLLKNRKLSQTQIRIVQSIAEKLKELTLDDETRNAKVDELLDLLANKQINKNNGSDINSILEEALMRKRSLECLCNFYRRELN